MSISLDSFDHESSELPLGKLKPDPKNPRNRDKRSVREIAKSIREFGFVQPIVVDEEYRIIIGHGRYAAAKHLKYSVVPVIIVKGLTEYQRKSLQVADNRVAEFSTWNNRLLSELLENMSEYRPLDIPGFDSEEFEKMLGISDYEAALQNLPPPCEDLNFDKEYHLLVSCTGEYFDKFVALKNTLKKEKWCELEEASR